MRYNPINSAFFTKNRSKYLQNLPEGSLSIFSSNDILPTNADGSFGFVQNTTFFYLTGVDQEDCYLLLIKGKGEWLFVKETSELIRVWDGEKLTKEQATTLSGIENVMWKEEFWNAIEQHLVNQTEVYIYQDETQKNAFESFRSKNTFVADSFRKKYPEIKILNPADIVNTLRLYKTPEEVEAIKVAIETTHKGLKRMAKFIKPGKYEFEVEAELTHEIMMNRSRHHAFMPIIASGANACVLHYVDNHAIIKDGDLVLIDFGAEYGNYKADMTRVLPANGRFSERQKQIYNSVLYVMREIIKRMVTGNTILNLKNQTSELIGLELVKLGVITEEKLQKSKSIVNKYFPHGVSHSLGLDVHDVGSRDIPLAPGMVLTCEPGIYIPEEGIGIRLENDILITEEGNIDLMAHVPIEIEDIEKLML